MQKFNVGDWATVTGNRDDLGVYHDFMIGEQAEILAINTKLGCVLCTNERDLTQWIYFKDVVLGRMELTENG